MKLGIIGLGNMANAIVQGLLAKKIISHSFITGIDVNPTQTKAFVKRFKIRPAQDLCSLLSLSDVVLLAVKPQQFGEVLTELKTSLTPKHLILSIAAGIDTKAIRKKLGPKTKVVRLMPNTPALLGAGATAYFATSNCKPADRKLVEKLFGAVGLILPVRKEALLDAVTALSGSGPAFVYKFVAEMAEGGKKLGLKEEIALKLAIQTVLGASLMLKETGESPQNLISKVTSKGGTTLAGLSSLGKNGFEKIIHACLKAAADRAEELRKMVG